MAAERGDKAVTWFLRAWCARHRFPDNGDMVAAMPRIWGTIREMKYLKARPRRTHVVIALLRAGPGLRLCGHVGRAAILTKGAHRVTGISRE